MCTWSDCFQGIAKSIGVHSNGLATGSRNIERTFERDAVCLKSAIKDVRPSVVPLLADPVQAGVAVQNFPEPEFEQLLVRRRPSLLC